MLDELKNQMKSGVVMLATSSEDKVNLIAGVTNDLTAKVKAGELVNLVAQQVGGKGVVVLTWRRRVVPSLLRCRRPCNPFTPGWKSACKRAR